MKKNIIIITAIYITFSVISCNIPLLNYLGFEFSFLTAIISSILSGIFAISYLKKNFLWGMEKNVFFLHIKKIFLFNLSFLLIPLIIISLNAFFIKNCSFINGFFFFLLLPCITTLYVTSLAIFIFFNIERKKKFVYLLTLFLLTLFLILPYYFHPQAYLYNPFFGYVNPIIYDEGLSITYNLILYRINNLLESIILLFLSLSIALEGSRNIRITDKIIHLKNGFLRYKFLFFAALLVVSFWLFRNELHIVMDKPYIEKQIGGKYSTEHFNIYYSPKNYTGEEVIRLGRIHELYFEQISRQLKVKFPYRIESFIYASPEQKSELIGAKYTDIAKPWLHQIHINTGDERTALKHEMIHVMAGEFGLPVFNASLQPGLTEGIAMAIDWDWGNRTLDEYSALLKKTGFFIDMENIINVKGFFSRNASYSYILSGAFSRFLISRYGIEKYKEIYSFAGFEKVYSKSLNDLSKEWNEHLDTIPVNPCDTVLMKYLFGRKSIFSKVCPRVIANINESAQNEFRNRNYEKAKELYSKSISLSFSNESALGLIQTFFQLQKYDSVLNITRTILEDEKQMYSGLLFRLYRGDAFWFKAIKENNYTFIDSAIHNYSILRDLQISEYYDFILNARISCIGNKKTSGKMLEYFILKRDDFLKAVVLKDVINENPDFYEGKLLLAEALLNKKEYSESLRYLDLTLNSSTNDFFNKEKFRLAGMNLFYLKDYSNAQNNFQIAKNLEKLTVRKNRIDEWIVKCRYFERFK